MKEQDKENQFPNLFKLNNPVDVDQRSEKPFSDNLKLSKALIYKVLGPKDDRLQVLPLAMEGIEESEMKNLPRYPCWIKGQVITGKSIDKDGKENADQIWITSTPDFQLGYVVGRCNAFGENTNQKWPYSYNFKSVKDFLHGRSALPKDFDYSHYDVIRMVMTEDGGMIEMCNNRNGDWILLNTSGSIITVQQQKIYIRTGTPPNPPSAGPVGFSAITLTPDKIHMKTPNFEVDAKDTVLGHHNLDLAGITGGIVMGKNGVNVQQISNIHV
jgi:hypothetical protein